MYALRKSDHVIIAINFFLLPKILKFPSNCVIIFYSNTEISNFKFAYVSCIRKYSASLSRDRGLK